jgi:hypothetical protein
LGKYIALTVKGGEGILSVRLLALVAALLASVALAAPAAASGRHGERPRPSTATGAGVPAPAVSGPIARTSPVGDPAHGYPFLATDVDLAAAGYVEQEFQIAGTATRYTNVGTTTGTALATGHPYRTRIVVRRPRSGKDFNGAVIAEWYNVSNQWDQEVDWFQTHEHLIREGYVWVGISAQRAGVHSPTGLSAWSPSRYGALDVEAGGTITDNSLSYDIFSQAVKAIRSPAGTDPLGPLSEPDYVIATGHSQSASLLRQYYNSILPLSNILDAVVLHGWGQTVRDDVGRPVFRINSEGDVASLGAAVRQPDTPLRRTWEVAGASHGDWKLITDYGPLRKRDIGTYPGGYPGEPQTCALPSLSRVPQHMVQNALYDHTLRWVMHGIAPPRAPVITTSGTPATIARDELGLALGGIRLAQHEVPLRINSGVNTGPGFCFLDGSSVPLTDAQLEELYPTVRSYVKEFVKVTLDNVEAGYIPRSFTRDPAWYSDIRELIGDYHADGRIADRVATKLIDGVARAARAGTAGNELAAIVHLAAVDLRARLELRRDPAVRDAVLRPTDALIALLSAAKRR